MNVMDLVAKISLDSSDYDSGVDSAKSKFSGLGNALKSGAKAIGGLTVGALKATTAAIGGAATGIAALTKSAYSAYADYEQLKGGLETMFEDLAYDVEENAKKAYATSGMSVNQYMETVMGFSASLNQALMANEGNIARAAEVSDQIISDMADNSSKMGTSMESIQSAYAGFAKGQFQLLDNLKLGYGGTASEMQRLLDDAEKLTGKKFDISNFADITEAIHVIQEDLGIAGNAAEEASKTLSGSFGAMQASWQNLVTGFANPEADISELVSQFIGSATNLIRNAIPVVSQALKGIGQAVTEIIPLIAQELPSLINDLLPPILSAATTLIQTLASELPNILSVLVDQIPVILPALLEATTTLITALAQQLPSLVQMLLPAVIQVAVTLISAIGSQLPDIIGIFADILIVEIPKLMSQIQSNISKFTSGLTKILKSIGDLIIKLTPVILPVMINVAIELLKSLAQGFSENASEVISSIISLINDIVTILTEPSTLSTILECGLQIILAIVQGLLDNAPQLISAALELITNLLGWFVTDGGPMILNAAGSMFEAIGEGLLNAWSFVKSKIGELLGKVIGEDGIGGWISDILGKAQEAFESIGDGISQAWETITGAVTEFGTKIWNGIKEGLGNLWEKGKEIVMDVVQGIKDSYHFITEALMGSGVSKDVSAMMEKAGKDGSNSYVKGTEEGYDINSPSKKMKWIGEMVMAGFNEGMEEEGVDPLKVDPIDVNNISGISKKSASKTSAERKMDQLLELMSEIVNNREGITIPVFVGGRQIDEAYIDSKNRVTVRSGGQVSV